MASIDTGGGGGGKKGSPKRINTRVDFTPMVDMNMLLLTFFMFCTTLSKPQVMNLILPIPDDEIKTDNLPKDTTDDQAYTFILDENNKIYYFNGTIKDESYGDYTFLKETAYPSKDNNGFRDILLEKNAGVINRIKELREKRDATKMSKEDYDKAVSDIKKDKTLSRTAPVIVIKAVNPNLNAEGVEKTKGATYKNFVDVLDEMAICNIARYAVVDITDADLFVLNNLKTKGAYSAAREIPSDASKNAPSGRRR